MYTSLIITSALLAVCAAFDGKSTADFLTKGRGNFVEGDPIMVFLFGSNTPTSKRMWITGSLTIAAEIAIALIVSYLWHPAVWCFYVQQFAQSGIHIYNWRSNETSLTSYLKSSKK